MTKVLPVGHSGLMNIMMCQKSGLGNISNELNYTRKKDYLVMFLFHLLMALPVSLKGSFASEQKSLHE